MVQFYCLVSIEKFFKVISLHNGSRTINEGTGPRGPHTIQTYNFTLFVQQWWVQGVLFPLLHSRACTRTHACTHQTHACIIIIITLTYHHEVNRHTYNFLPLTTYVQKESHYLCSQYWNAPLYKLTLTPQKRTGFSFC